MAATAALSAGISSAVQPSSTAEFRRKCWQANTNSTVGIQLPKRPACKTLRTAYFIKNERLVRCAAGVDDSAGPEASRKPENENSGAASSTKGGFDGTTPTGVSWQAAPRLGKDDYHGWSMPIELDSGRTDISINAGLPECTAALALAVSVVVVALTAMQKKGGVARHSVENGITRKICSQAELLQRTECADFQQVSFEPTGQLQAPFRAAAEAPAAVEAEEAKAVVPTEQQKNQEGSEESAVLPSDDEKVEVEVEEEGNVFEDPSLGTGQLQMAGAAAALGVEQFMEEMGDTQEDVHAAKNETNFFSTHSTKEGSKESVQQAGETEKVNELSLSEAEGAELHRTQGPSASSDDELSNEPKQKVDSAVEISEETETEEPEISFSMLMPWAKAMGNEVEGHAEVSEEVSSSAAPQEVLSSAASKEVSLSAASQEVSPSAASEEVSLVASQVGDKEETKDTPIVQSVGEEKEEKPQVRRSIVSPPAPVTSAGLPDSQVPRAGRVVVQPVVDSAHLHAVEALQALRVLEEDVEPGGICTRRQYARWILTASSVLSRNPSERIFPSMCVEDLTELAFDDVLPGDPDFAAIQGLAEAGLISSNLSRKDLLCDRNVGQSGCSPTDTGPNFRPDGPLSRQDLISWKIALEHRNLPKPDVAALRKVSGFIDVDRIDPDALPAIAADLAAGDKSLITAAFGFTRRFEPKKPVTCAQAAVTLALGQSAEIVGEELARMEAEKVAVAAWEAAEALEREEVERERRAADEAGRGREEERRRLVEVTEQIESALGELERVKAEREGEKEGIEKAKADLAREGARLSTLADEMGEIMEDMGSVQQTVGTEIEVLEGLRVKVAAEREATEKAKAELDAEKEALAVARSRAESEAKRARDEFRRFEIAESSLDKDKIPKSVDAKSEDGAVEREEVVPLPRWEAVPTEEGAGAGAEGVGASKKEEGFFGDWSAEELMAKGEKMGRDTSSAVGEAMGKAAETVRKGAEGAVGAVGRAGEVVSEAVEKAGSAMSGGGGQKEAGEGVGGVGGAGGGVEVKTDWAVETVVGGGEKKGEVGGGAGGGGFGKFGDAVGGTMAIAGDVVNETWAKVGGGVGEMMDKTGHAWEETKLGSHKMILEMVESTQAGAAGLAGSVGENAKRFSEACKQEAGKFVARFKAT